MPNKICPVSECSSAVNVRKLCCDCSHVFALRHTKRVSIKSRMLEMQALRAMERMCDVLNRRSHDKNRIAAKRAKESEQEKAGHRMSDKKFKLAKRAEETEQQKADHRKSDKSDCQKAA